MTADPAERYRLLVEGSAADVHIYFLRRLADADDAADAASDVLLTVWRRRSAIPTDRTEARMWLFGVAGNALRNSRRSRTRQRAVLVRLATDRTSRQGVRTETSSADVGERVREAIQALPEQAAELVRLHHWDGFTLQEIATILDVPASTVRSRYATARARLRDLLEAGEESQADGVRRTHAPRLTSPPEAGPAIEHISPTFRGTRI